MKRDLELIRKIVLTIEDSPEGWAPQDLDFEGYSETQFSYHAYLLINAGLAEGPDMTTAGSSGPEAIITHPTWAGHEFAAVARDDRQWAYAMVKVKEKGGEITLGVLIELLGGLMKATFGLP